MCDSGLLGIIILLISSALSGFLFTTLVWCNSHTWIYFKHKGRYIKVDDQDPYMPLSTIERPRMTPALAAGSISGIGTYGTHRGQLIIHSPKIRNWKLIWFRSSHTSHSASNSALSWNTKWAFRTWGSCHLRTDRNYSCSGGHFGRTWTWTPSSSSASC